MLNKERGWIIALISMVLVISYACQDQPLDPVNTETDHAFNSLKIEDNNLAAAKNKQRNFRANLNGESEVPPVETNAQGQSTFKVSKDETSIDYKLIVANIENVTMAHIHLAPIGQNGGVIVWLYPPAAPPQLIEGRSQGILAEGTITETDLVGALEGQTLDDLLNEMKNGNTYVNVHTSQNPAGEVRGQIH